MAQPAFTRFASFGSASHLNSSSRSGLPLRKPSAFSSFRWSGMWPRFHGRRRSRTASPEDARAVMHARQSASQERRRRAAKVRSRLWFVSSRAYLKIMFDQLLSPLSSSEYRQARSW